MFKCYLLIVFCFLANSGFSQRRISAEDAIGLAFQNRINTTPAELGLQQQQQLLRGSNSFDNPELEYEIDPYDPTVLGVIVPLRLPNVYSSRKRLQKERIKLSELLLRLNNNEINRLVQNTYTEVQFLNARAVLLAGQDSLYQSIKNAAQRSFQAGQINKLEELFASNEANNVNNELQLIINELAAQKKALSYIINFNEDFTFDTFQPLSLDSLLYSVSDSIPAAVQQQILQQQIAISQKQLKVEKAELLPQVNAGPLFGLQNADEGSKKLGFRLGVSIPLWFGQNKSRIRAAQTGVQLAEAQRRRGLQDLQRDYQLTKSSVTRAQKNISYYNTIAIKQADEITETALRLFLGGQVSYIETLRNIIIAYQTRSNYLETIRSYNQAVIELRYLTGNF